MKNASDIDRRPQRILFAATLLVASSALCGCLQAQEQNNASRFYFSVNSGVAWQQDISVKEKDQVSGSVTREKVQFDSGLRLDVGGGYQFTDCLAAELEAGVIFNAVSGDSGNTRLNADGINFLQVPFFVNVVGRIPTRTRLKPWVGVGVGGMYTSLESFGYYLSSVRSDDTDVVFAYQGLAGLRYEMTRRVELGLAYKYTATLDHTFDRLSTTTSGNQVHSVLASVLIRW